MTRLDCGYPPGWPAVLLHHHLLRHATTHPQNTAVVSGEQQWSYAELAARARTCAETLLDAGLHAGDAVCVSSRPCAEAVALVCGLSMAGMVYVPVNPDHPPARIAEIRRISDARLHITGPGAAPAAAGEDGALARLDGEGLQITGTPPGRPTTPPVVIESDPAYMIFTSGTTGRPKGIVISHRAISVGIRALLHHCALDTADRVGSLAPLSFDFSISDMALALGSGAALVCVPPLLVHHPARLLRHLDDQGITVMSSVPWVWHTCLQHAPDDVAALRHLRTIFVAGESFPISDVARLRELRPGLRIVNGFGHSESMCCSFTDVPLPLPAGMETIPIGTGHPGTELLLLDAERRPVAEPGVAGEIYLRGANLFDGYWQDLDTTARVLVPDPLAPARGRVFKTGDHAYRGSDGQLYFAGRRDHQVQVQGMRVELEEVERALGRHPAVGDVAVVDIAVAGGTELVAFVVARLGHAVPAGPQLRAFAAETLPQYMLPAHVATVGELPLTLHGKLDRPRLRELWTVMRAADCRKDPASRRSIEAIGG
jgi:amino acid adenylation domain-containing protein